MRAKLNVKFSSKQVLFIKSTIVDAYKAGDGLKKVITVLPSVKNRSEKPHSTEQAWQR